MQATVEVLAEKYELYGCIQCGMCTGGCPVSIRSELNPRKLIYFSLIQNQPNSDQKIWECTTCGTCKLRCPKGVSPLDLIIGFREKMVEGGRLQPTLRDALESTFKHGNPWGGMREKRFDWADGLNLRNASEEARAEWLYYVGCTPSYDPRVQKVALALVTVFQKAEIDFCVLGNEETCCGNEIKRMGELGLFELLEEDQHKIFENYAPLKVVTTSPHCYNVFKNEMDLGFDVYHYTQVIAQLLLEGKLSFPTPVEKKVTFHDPCFLGKQNGLYEEPRIIINSIPGLKFTEFDRTRDRSLCCEGGGGRMWVESQSGGEKLAEVRVKDAKELGVDIILTSCPFCLLTLEDAVKTAGLEESLQIMDIVELALQSLQGG